MNSDSRRFGQRRRCGSPTMREDMDCAVEPSRMACLYPNLFSFALEARRILAGGETTGMPVVIAFAPRQGRRTRARIRGFRSSKPRPAPLPGGGVTAQATGGFTHWFLHKSASPLRTIRASRRRSLEVL